MAVTEFYVLTGSPTLDSLWKGPPRWTESSATVWLLGPTASQSGPNFIELARSCAAWQRSHKSSVGCRVTVDDQATGSKTSIYGLMFDAILTA